MANTIITPQIIANRAIRVLRNESAMLGRINTAYRAEYSEDKKPGDMINIRQPVQLRARSGPVANLQDVVQASVPLVLQPEVGCDFTFSDFDLRLKIEDFERDFITPGAIAVATEIDIRLAGLYKKIANSVTPATMGTMPTTQLAAQKLVLDAGVKLSNNSAPRGSDKRTLLVGEQTQADFLSPLNLSFNHQSEVGRQYMSGTMGTALGFEWADSPNTPVHTVGPLGGTPLTNGANQGLINSGATDNPRGQTTSLLTKGWTAAAALRVKAGDVFTIAGVFEVNPVNRQSTGALRQFVVTTDTSSDGAGNATIPISPAIIAGGAYQNVTARPADGAAMTFLGTAGASYEQNLGFVEDAFTFVSVALEMPNGVDMKARADEAGVAMRFIRDFDTINNRRICRFDMIPGYDVLRAEWAVRIWGRQVS